MRNGSRGLKLDLGHKHRKNGSVTFPDFDEAGPQKNDFLWLSSDCRSPSMLSFDAGQDPFPFQGAMDGYSKQEVLTWLQDSDDNSVVCSSESGDSCCFTQSLCDGSSCTSTTLSAQEEDAATTTCAGGLDSAADIWVSSLDLDVEDSEFVQCKEQGFDIFGSDFPSPSIRSKQSLPELISSPHTENCDSNEEALFWPFDQKSYILRDFEKNFLCLSPRKDLRNVGAKVLERSKSISPGVESRSTYRKITISPPPSTAASNKRMNQNTTAPSRLSRLHRASSDKYDCSTISRKEKLLQKKTQISEPLLDLEMDIFRSLVAAQGAAIESLVGLNEFDGHEGIGVDCDDDDGNELVLD